MSVFRKRRAWSVVKYLLVLTILIAFAEGYLRVRAWLEQTRLDEWAGVHQDDGARFFEPTLSELGIKEIIRDADRDGVPESAHVEFSWNTPWGSGFTLFDDSKTPGYDKLILSVARYQLEMQLRDKDGDGIIDQSILDFRQEPGSVLAGEAPVLTGRRYRYRDFDGDRYFDLIEEFDGEERVNISVITGSELMRVIDGRPDDGSIAERADGTLVKVAWEDGGWTEVTHYSVEEAQSLFDALNSEDSG